MFKNSKNSHETLRKWPKLLLFPAIRSKRRSEIDTIKVVDPLSTGLAAARQRPVLATLHLHVQQRWMQSGEFHPLSIPSGSHAASPFLSPPHNIKWTTHLLDARVNRRTQTLGYPTFDTFFFKRYLRIDMCYSRI